ncbi:hypothetical protein DDI_2297 [Dickeya dianthicola RNS04.9]|nr:hypothetical protein DDI_2297 [Dickeya dianthicola RNS04.9]
MKYDGYIKIIISGESFCLFFSQALIYLEISSSIFPAIKMAIAPHYFLRKMKFSRQMLNLK